MVKYGLNTIFLVFPVGFGSTRREVSLLFRNNSLNIYLLEESIFDINVNWEYMPQTFYWSNTSIDVNQM